jgi:hypothetical protein
MAWLTGWEKRRKITIKGETGAGTDYQILLKVGESADSSDDDFHIGGNSKSFPTGKDVGGDLRFTASDGTTELKFWVEKVIGSSPNRTAVIWVKVSADLGSNQDIYIYYDNDGSPANGSSGSDTFLLFDDFPGTSLDTDKWTSYAAGSGVVSVAGSNLNCNLTGGGTGKRAAVRSKNTVAYSHRVLSRIKLHTDNTMAFANGIDSSIDANNYARHSHYGSCENAADYKHRFHLRVHDGTTTTVWASGARNIDTWYLADLMVLAKKQISKIRSDSDLSLLEDFSITARDVGTNARYIGAFAELMWFNNTDSDSRSRGAMYFDYIAVGKFVETEPAFNVAGGEEEVAATPYPAFLLNLIT